MKQRKKSKLVGRIFSILSAVAFIIYTAACSGSSDDLGAAISSGAKWKESSAVTYQSGTSTILLQGEVGTKWSAEITEGSSWCSFSYKNSTSGKSGSIAGTLDVLYVYYSENNTDQQRTASIVITFDDGGTSELLITQIAADQQNEIPFGRWAELPANATNSNYVYLTHYVTLNSNEVRNYSLCLDKTKKAALWVAYPLHSCYLGGSSRSEAWAFDPLIDEEYQPNLTKSYKGSYDRGHQLPSADRLATSEMNQQTFYFSNMTPQASDLNQKMWAKLEAKVRNNKCDDTLYVVTGAYFGSGAGTTTDGVGNTVPIPTHYYKVLLRTKSGNSKKAIKDCTADELISIGFWVEQKSYGDIEPPTSICTTVKEIETKTGFTFFPTVDESVKKQNNPTQWGIN